MNANLHQRGIEPTEDCPHNDALSEYEQAGAHPRDPADLQVSRLPVSILTKG
jgi:hypothetical protein